MITKSTERTQIQEIGAENGEGLLKLDKLLLSPNMPQKVRTYAKATLEPGASVGFHIHNNESESYYILSGVAEYNDNGTIYNISEGDVTFTPNGQGHGIKNIGKDNLEFMALIVLD